MQEMRKCANEMELSAALNAIYADVQCGGKPSVREHCFTDRLYSCTVIDSTQLCRVTHVSTGSFITTENATRIDLVIAFHCDSQLKSNVQII